jgi:hypothetical protein
MSKIDDGGPAYPTTIRVKETNPATRTGHTCMVTTVKEIPMPGMSLRDWFATAALKATLGHERTFVGLAQGAIISGQVCASAYEWADAMIAARKGEACN